MMRIFEFTDDQTRKMCNCSVIAAARTLCFVKIGWVCSRKQRWLAVSVRDMPVQSGVHGNGRLMYTAKNEQPPGSERHATQTWKEENSVANSHV